MPKLEAGAFSRVAAVLVNWRAADETIAAVTELQSQSSPLERIYVVDNGSQDGSFQLLEAALSAYGNVTLIESAANLGFGGGCNLALTDVLNEGMDFVWLVNNDARPDANCLQSLMAEMTGDPTMGMVGSMLTDPSHPDQDHSGSWLHPWLMICGAVRTVDDLERHHYSWVTAASVLIRSEALARSGLFDERFFMYWEDADLTMRIRKSGYRISIAPDARVAHRAGTSSSKMVTQRYAWHYRSQRIWLAKHHSWPRLAQTLLQYKFILKAIFDLDRERLIAILRA